MALWTRNVFGTFEKRAPECPGCDTDRAGWDTVPTYMRFTSAATEMLVLAEIEFNSAGKYAGLSSVEFNIPVLTIQFIRFLMCFCSHPGGI